MLQGKLSDVGANFKDVLEVRTKNIQQSRSRTEEFISSVSQHAQPPLQQSASPLYGTPNRGTPSPGADLLSLNPVGDQQMLMMEEAQPQNAYIQQRGEAIEAIEKTIGELGSIFGQLAQMVSEQSEYVTIGYTAITGPLTKPSQPGVRSGEPASRACLSRWRATLTQVPQNDPAHRCQHGRRRRQRLGCTEGTAQVLVESEQQPVADRKGEQTRPLRRVSRSASISS